ncbi:uncharacterized protein LOC127378077 isoform X2 [Dicentrarchus labrax]|uniref:uncharacterized protein LOC127378077 isoform X2 n=1 Tax=Dicentrarchus labrax TaxID=13489 RepID=UPI0021F53EAA|nr:uncharacterized protein LOC127378077 isoform X2 [Dicentrarchus labrax]
MKDIFPKFLLKQFSTFIAIIVIFVYNVVLNKDLKCSCQQQTRNCNLYMALPFCILFVLQLWTDKTFQRTLKYGCTFCWVLLCHILKAVFVGLLWVVSVFVDGDWFVCCWNDHSDKQAQLACKEEKDITPEEKTIIADLKDTSLVIGLCVLLGALVIAFIISSVKRMKCCKDSCCCNRKNLYYKVILEEEKDAVKETFRKSAQKQLKNKIKSKIQDEHWEQCFDVAGELIKENQSPEYIEEQEEQQPEQKPGQQPEQRPEQQPEQQPEPQPEPHHSGEEPSGTEDIQSGTPLQPLSAESVCLLKEEEPTSTYSQ